MTTRRDLNLPDGWRPGHHSTVQILNSATLRPADVPVPGTWRCVHPAPDAGWWLLPANPVAHNWLRHHGGRVGATSGMINAHGLRLVPAWVQLPLPSS